MFRMTNRHAQSYATSVGKNLSICIVRLLKLSYLNLRNHTLVFLNCFFSITQHNHHHYSSFSLLCLCADLMSHRSSMLLLSGLYQRKLAMLHSPFSSRASCPPSNPSAPRSVDRYLYSLALGASLLSHP